MSFQRRGYLEGFYGKPWTDAQRRDMIALMAAHGMNTYAYGAKDDPIIVTSGRSSTPPTSSPSWAVWRGTAGSAASTSCIAWLRA